MDVLKEISDSHNRDIVIRLDEAKTWTEHINFFQHLRVSDLFFEHIVDDIPKTSKGCKCYLIYGAKICGWVEIFSIEKIGNDVIIKMFPYFNSDNGKMDTISFKEQYRYFYNNSFDQ